MNDNMFIPTKLNVGYQLRKDTYSGKLAYVVYTDNKGKLRKAGSWNSWCSSDIPKDEFDNVPTNGFVINRDVGGVRSGWSNWDSRMEKVRVYDPRGFEIEITIPNLLFLLEECTSTKGKGLEGDFVYAWSGPSMVLVPITSAEYAACTKFTTLQSQKISKSDMVEGAVYVMKDTTKVVYLGKHQYYEQNRNYIYTNKNNNSIEGNTLYTHKISKKSQVFYDLENKRYIFDTGFTKLAKKEADNYPDFANLYTTFIASSKTNPISHVEFIESELPSDRYSLNHNTIYVKLGNEYHSVHFDIDNDYDVATRMWICKGINMYTSNIPVVWDSTSIDVPSVNVPSRYWGVGIFKKYQYLSTDDLRQKEKFYKIKVHFEKGETSNLW